MKRIFAQRKSVFFAFVFLLFHPALTEAATSADVTQIAARVLQAAQADATDIGATLAVDGAPTVTPEDGLYRVQLPHLILTTADGGQLDLGRPRAAFMPQENGGWKIGLIFSTAQWSRPGATPVMIDPGQQDITALWLGDKDGLGSLQLHSKKLSFSGGATGSIADFALDFDLHPAFGGGRRGPMTASVHDVAVMAEGSSFRLGSLALRGDLEMLAPDAPRAGVAGVSVHGIVQSIAVERAADKDSPTRHYTLPEADFDLAARGNREDKDQAQLDARYAGLTVQPADAAPAVPAHLTLSAHFSALPAGGLIAMVRELSSTLLADEGKKERKAERNALLALLERAHTRIETKTLAFGNGYYDAHGNGAVTMSDTSPSGAIGSATASVAGIDKVLQALNGAPPTIPLTVLQLVGKPGANSARRYDVEWRADGPVLFNGQDIAGLLQGASALSGLNIKLQ